MAEVSFDAVGKVYADGTRALEALDLRIADGELLVLVGPSGCGKTTALRMLAGLEDVTEGEIRIGDRVVNDVPPRDRDIAMVFQSYALYPHLTVEENIGFGLALRKVPKDEIRRRVEAAARSLGLEEHLRRKPRNLSGGQRQRVAMGRAIVREPSVFLMDEPLSNLDAKLRVQMRAEVARIRADLGVTTLYVTHDQTEAMTLGDRVAVLRKGRLQQIGPPQELYEEPYNLFVAGFIGSPAMNVLSAQVTAIDGRPAARAGSAVLPLPPDLEPPAGGGVIVGIRPEDLEDARITPPGEDEGTLAGRVVLTEALGSDVFVHVHVDADGVDTDDTRELAADAGAPDGGPLSGPGATVVARCDPRTTARPGEDIRLTVATARMHLFDPATGRAIRRREPAWVSG